MPLSLRSLILPFLGAASIVGAQAPAPSVNWGFGVAAGQMRFADASTERALGVTITARAWDWVDFSVNPSYAWAQSAPGQVGTVPQLMARTASGFTDLPVTLGVSHALPGAWSPSFGLSLGMTLPTGDSATIGAGTIGVGANASLGFAPTDNVSITTSAGRSISDGYSAGLGSSSPTSLALGTTFAAGSVSLGLSLAGDVGPVPLGTTRSRSIAGGVAIPLGGGLSLNVDGSTGLNAGPRTWALAAGIGTTPAGIVAATVAPYQRLRQAFGIGRKVKSHSKTKSP